LLESDRRPLHTWEGWLHLATVIDAHSRRVIGWAIDDEHRRADLVQDAWPWLSRSAGNCQRRSWSIQTRAPSTPWPRSPPSPPRTGWPDPWAIRASVGTTAWRVLLATLETGFYPHKAA